MVLVFDLDDTLYDEITFVKSGYRAVAKWLNEYHNLEENAVYDYMMEVLQRQGRGAVFDEALIKYGILSKSLVRKCLSIYRHHIPDIHLNEDARDCLERFKHYSKYIVTDGNKIVQANKIKALELHKISNIKKAFITYRYGLKHSKPSPYCLLKICELEKVSPPEVIYIGDNPNKDFVGIRPLGFRTIRIVQGMFKDVSKNVEFEADMKINSLHELNEEILNS